MLRISPRRATKPPDRLMNRSPSGWPGLVSRLEFGERRRSAASRRNTREERLPMSKKSVQRQAFKNKEYVVYPAHGVGQVIGIEEQEIAGLKLELYVISFEKDKMILRVPTSKVANVGMRKLADAGTVEKALAVLTGRARIKRTMWSRRAQEYEAKINSGDIIAIAEVVRDLHRAEAQPEQSYSERQLYEAALDRMARELSAVRELTATEAIAEIERQLAKGPRRTRPNEAEELDAQEEAA
jgi:CarD family transcriptional regulator